MTPNLIKLDDQYLFQCKITLLKERGIGSEINFCNLFAWAEQYQYYYIIFADIIWQFKMIDGKIIELMPPLGDISQLSLVTLKGLASTMLPFLKSKCFYFSRLTESGVDVLKPYASIVKALPEHDDYVYCAEAMATLPGTLYRKKRQAIQKLTSSPESFFTESITASNVKDCQLFLKTVNAQNKSFGIENETIAGLKMLDHFVELNCSGIIIKNTKSQIVAFSLGNELDDKTYLIHFEKANREYPGLYQYIFNIYAKELVKKYPFINREQDLGIEGLRQAKSSYYPIKKIKKYAVEINVENLL